MKLLKKVQGYDSLASPNSPNQAPWSAIDTKLLSVLLLLGLILRLLFFTGFYGSDEVTYLSVAHDILNGDWIQSDYIGSIRYGINIPMAVSMGLFGVSEFSANLWSLATSIAELALVYVAAQLMWGTKPAFASCLLLAFLPLHVHYAGRIMADAPLAFFISLCFFLVWMAERRNSIAFYVFAGLSLGAVYWIKDAVFYLVIAVGGIYVLVAGRWHLRWLWGALGAGVLVFLNFLLMWKVNGNPLHLFELAFNSIERISQTPKHSLFFYFSYLLLDLKHMFIVFYLALGAVVLRFRRYTLSKVWLHPEDFVLVWAFGFLAVLSPLALAQVNYMLIFAAPLTLLAGFFVSKLEFRLQIAVLGLVVVCGTVLAAFEQQVVHTFTANSRATVTFAVLHPKSFVFAGTGANRAERYQNVLEGESQRSIPIQSLAQLDDLLVGKNDLLNRSTLNFDIAKQAFTVMDPQTAGWGDANDSRWADRISSPCLVRYAQLEPAGMGLGRYVVDAFLRSTALLPDALAGKVSGKLQSSLRPQTATIFQVIAPCFNSDGPGSG